MSARNAQPLPAFPFWGKLVFAGYISVFVTYILGLLSTLMIQRESWRADFTSFYTAWYMVINGQGNQLYDFTRQADIQQQILAGNYLADGVLPFVNPPYVAVLLAPMALLPREGAFFLWTGIQGILLVWTLRLLWHLTVTWQNYERWLLIAGVLAFLPLFSSLLLGTFSLWQMLCLTQFYRYLKQEKDTQAGIWLGVGLVKPQLVVAGAVMVLASQRWKALVSMLAVFCAMSIVSTLVLGWETWITYLDASRTFGVTFNGFGLDIDKMYTIRGTLALWLGSAYQVLINQVSLIGLFVILGIIAFLWRDGIAASDPRFEPRLALSITLSFIGSIHLYPHDALLIALPIMLLYTHIREHYPEHRVRYGLFSLSIPLLFFVSAAAQMIFFIVHIPVLVMLSIIVWSVICQRRL